MRDPEGAWIYTSSLDGHVEAHDTQAGALNAGRDDPEASVEWMWAWGDAHTTRGTATQARVSAQQAAEAEPSDLDRMRRLRATRRMYNPWANGDGAA